MDSSIKYRHAQLRPQQIRLLRAVHKPGSRDLQFEVTHVSRDAAPKYTAVSYTWGEQEPSRTIRLDGKIFRVRPNLWSCLYYLSGAQRGSRLGWSAMWVDAICINQQDDEEKSHQVSLMSRTYSDAQVLSVWLGLVPKYPGAASRGNCALDNTAWAGCPTPEQYSDGHVKTYDVDNFDWTGHLDELLNRPYWLRRWVIQEFLLARAIHLYCGGNIMTDWLCLRMMLEYETGIDSSLSSLLGHRRFHETVETAAKKHAAASLVLVRDPDMYPELASSLHELLVRHQGAECKDRRDRVFALMGLLSRDEHSMLSKFFPDYTLSEDEVCVISLSHLIHVNHDGVRVTTSSNDIFQGLGVKERRARAGLLARAKDFDYLEALGLDPGCVSKQMRRMFREEDFGQYGTLAGGSFHSSDVTAADDDSNGFVSLERGSAVGRATKFVIGAVVAACIWILLWQQYLWPYIHSRMSLNV